MCCGVLHCIELGNVRGIASKFNQQSIGVVRVDGPENAVVDLEGQRMGVAQTFLDFFLCWSEARKF
jgi:hypothetical protein